MIKRDLESYLIQAKKKFPVIAVVGPRQSGKTTIAKSAFADYTYVSLENFDNREFAQTDPQSFLAEYSQGSGLILDEIQHVPALFSYIQTEVDRTQKKGFFVVTCSQNFLLNEAITQTLAGRVAFMTLLPLSVSELQSAKLLANDVHEVLFRGGYPRLYVDPIVPMEWYPNYIRTYIERDVRHIKKIGDLSVFQRFMKLCAGRIGQLLNLSSLANDCGVSVGTAKSWLSILEASYIIFLLQPHYKNFSKRLVKSPKLYFYDTGLACSLLEIDSAKQLISHYLRGGLFESFVIAELLKTRFNQSFDPRYYFWRDKTGHEVDCIIERGGKLFSVEIKAGQTISTNYFTELKYWQSIAGDDAAQSFVVYASNENQNRSQAQVMRWKDVGRVVDAIYVDNDRG